MKCSRIYFSLLFVFLVVSCTQNKMDYSGEYYYSVPTDLFFSPVLSLSKSGTLVLKKGSDVYFTGTYLVNDNDLLINLNEGSVDNDTATELNNMTIKIEDKNTLVITSRSPLPFDEDNIRAYTFVKAK